MRVSCKNNYYGFQKGKYYKVIHTTTIFEKDDFITIASNEDWGNSWYRFRLNKSVVCVDGYVGENELYFYDYFHSTQDDRKLKLDNLSNL